MALVARNTNLPSYSLLQYSTTTPIPAYAPKLYRPEQVTYRQFELDGLTPFTREYFNVRSCAKRVCDPETGTFDTSPACPDEVPPLSGSWQKEVSPNVGGSAADGTAVDNELLGVAAISESDVWAVGWSQEPNAPPFIKRTLIEHFDGTAWSIVPSPNPAGDTQTVLYSVSGTSANDVWAVGSTHDGNFPSRTLIQHWDGTRWSIVPSPSPDNQINELRGVAALSATDAWAVGYSSGIQSEANIDTLILHWDGATWSEVPSPNVALNAANQLFGIGAISARDIWAVGSAGGGALAMHWDGTAWRVVPVEGNSGLSSEFLTGVSGSAGNDVWAVGQGRGVFSNRAGATLRHWDGVHWTTKVCRARSASNPPDDYEGGGPDSYFTGVSVRASNDAWVVGVAGSGPFILHWDGQAWTRVTHPRAFPNSATLEGVATSSGGGAWAVGREIEIDSSGMISTARTLIDRYRP